MRDTHAHLTWRLNFGIARGQAAQTQLALLTICHWVLLQKYEFISRGTQKHSNNTFLKQELFR